MPYVATMTGLLWHLLVSTVLTPGAAVLAPGFGVLATAAAVALLVGLLAHVAVAAAARLGRGIPRAVQDRTLRRRAWRTAFLPQRDPDARGRSRPRAPSAAFAAG
jgi:hypothetical protein